MPVYVQRISGDLQALWRHSPDQPMVLNGLLSRRTSHSAKVCLESSQRLLDDTGSRMEQLLYRLSESHKVY